MAPLVASSGLSYVFGVRGGGGRYLVGDKPGAPSKYIALVATIYGWDLEVIYTFFKSWNVLRFNYTDFFR